MKILETEALIVSIIDERIVHIFVKNFQTVTYKDAMETTEAITIYFEKNKLTKVAMNMVEFGHGATADKEVREYASTKQANNFTNGSAILVKNLAQQLIGDYYLKFNHPRYPTKVFYKKEKALNWIRNKLATYDSADN